MDQYENDTVRAMALVGKEFAETEGIDSAPHQAVIDRCAEITAALIGEGEPVPADLAEKTAVYVESIRAGYQELIAGIDAELALPEVLRTRGTDQLNGSKANAEKWLAALEAVWPEA